MCELPVVVAFKLKERLAAALLLSRLSPLLPKTGFVLLYDEGGNIDRLPTPLVSMTRGFLDVLPGNLPIKLLVPSPAKF